MTTVTFQNGRKFTFNPIYFANEFGDPQFFLHLNISFSLSNKYADLKQILYILFLKKLKNHDFSSVKKIINRIFFKICLFIT